MTPRNNTGVALDRLFSLPHGNRQPRHRKHRRVVATIANHRRLLQRHAQVLGQRLQCLTLVGQHRRYIQVNRLRTRDLRQALHLGLQQRFQLNQPLRVEAGGNDLVDAVQVGFEALHDHRPVAQAIGFALHHRPGRVAAQPVTVGKHPDLDFRLG